MGNDWFRFFLKVVGRQCMVGWSDESLKETPGSARNQAEHPGIRRGKRLGTGSPGRKTDLPCHRRSGNPKSEERKQNAPATVTPNGDKRQRRQRKQHAASHAPIAPGDR